MEKCEVEYCNRQRFGLSEYCLRHHIAIYHSPGPQHFINEPSKHVNSVPSVVDGKFIRYYFLKPTNNVFDVFWGVGKDVAVACVKFRSTPQREIWFTYRNYGPGSTFREYITDKLADVKDGDCFLYVHSARRWLVLKFIKFGYYAIKGSLDYIAAYKIERVLEEYPDNELAQLIVKASRYAGGIKDVPKIYGCYEATEGELDAILRAICNRLGPQWFAKYFTSV